MRRGFLLAQRKTTVVLQTPDAMKRAREPESVEHAGAAASTDEQSPLASIKAALGTGKAQVCCQGSLQLDPLPTLAGTDEAGQAFAVRLPLKEDAGSSADAAPEALQPLLDACEPAKFGKGTELVSCHLVASSFIQNIITYVCVFLPNE